MEPSTAGVAGFSAMLSAYLIAMATAVPMSALRRRHVDHCPRNHDVRGPRGQVGVADTPKALRIAISLLRHQVEPLPVNHHVSDVGSNGRDVAGGQIRHLLARAVGI